EEPQNVSEIILIFPGHLLREYHAYAPMYRDPQCVRDYDVQVAEANGEWKTVAEVRGNYQRRNVVRLSKAVPTRALRVVVHATNGDPSAAIYEVRAY
ncbi:MAG TPA: hypothetical protein VIM67_10530, partial [Terriglobus sp.]